MNDTRTPALHPTTRSLRAIGTTIIVAVADPATADLALCMLRSEITAIDLACSRFRDDSELHRLHRTAGHPVRVSSLLLTAVEVALSVAERTAGAVDPTVGGAVCAWGYDRDFAQIASRIGVLSPRSAAAGGDSCHGPRPTGWTTAATHSAATHPAATHPAATHPAAMQVPVTAPAGWWQVELDRRARTVRIPHGVVLDLGATAKALAADRAAARIAETTGTGVLVSIGGDVAVAGPSPDGGWAVGIAPMSSSPLHALEQVVTIDGGGLASSSPAARSWMHRGVVAHHIIDPATGAPAARRWRLVSAAGSSCVEANAATTASVVWGADAPDRLVAFGTPARLVGEDGDVVTVNGWPDPTVVAKPVAPRARTGTSGRPLAALSAAGGAGSPWPDGPKPRPSRRLLRPVVAPTTGPAPTR